LPISRRDGVEKAPLTCPDRGFVWLLEHLVELVLDARQVTGQSILSWLS